MWEKSNEPENKSAHIHEPNLIPHGAHSENDLTAEDKRGEDHGTESNAEHSVDQKAAEEAQENVRPTVPAVEGGESRRGDSQVLFELVL